MSWINQNDKDGWIEIDGSYGEGGGQMIRNSTTLACILKRKIRVTKIRASRTPPGLASQHLASIRTLVRLTSATCPSNLSEGLMEFDLDASGDVRGEAELSKAHCFEATVDLKTAGSVTLCSQCILPYLFSLRSPPSFKILIIGGTHVVKAPTVDYIQRVFVPIMNQIGYNFNLQLLRPGYFPEGGGRITLDIPSGNNGKFHHFKLNQRGKLVEKSAILNLTPPLYDGHKEMLTSRIKSVESNSLLVSKMDYAYASIEYFLKYEHAAFGFCRLLEGNPPGPTADEVIEAIDVVEAEFLAALTSSACVDSFMQDELIIYMTLAKLQDPSQSSIYTTMAPLTDHTLSAIHVSQLMTGLEFHVTMSNGIIQVSI